jgi:hypothetical protein
MLCSVTERREGSSSAGFFASGFVSAGDGDGLGSAAWRERQTEAAAMTGRNFMESF